MGWIPPLRQEPQEAAARMIRVGVPREIAVYQRSSPSACQLQSSPGAVSSQGDRRSAMPSPALGPGRVGLGAPL